MGLQVTPAPGLLSGSSFRSLSGAGQGGELLALLRTTGAPGDGAGIWGLEAEPPGAPCAQAREPSGLGGCPRAGLEGAGELPTAWPHCRRPLSGSPLGQRSLLTGSRCPCLRPGCPKQQSHLTCWGPGGSPGLFCTHVPWAFTWPLGDAFADPDPGSETPQGR